MWLERLGTVDERIFIAFGVVTGVITILTVINMFLNCCSQRRPPGHSVTLLLIYSTVVICTAVLFRGVQCHWGSLQSLRPLCPIFTALMLVGYTTFTSCLLSQSWAILFKYKWNCWREWHASLTVWILVILAGISVIIWVILFSPDLTWRNTTVVSVYNESIYVCGGWNALASHDYHQFAWRVAFSVYFAAILLLAIISLPIHCTLRLSGDTDSATRLAVVTVILNATCCVIVGLIVWFQLHRDLYDDTYKYAIIGSLQLWMLLVCQVALLAANIVERSSQKSRFYHLNTRHQHTLSLGAKPDTDKVSVSDGDGTLNSAMTSDYYE